MAKCLYFFLHPTPYTPHPAYFTVPLSPRKAKGFDVIVVRNVGYKGQITNNKELNSSSAVDTACGNHRPDAQNFDIDQNWHRQGKEGQP